MTNAEELFHSIAEELIDLKEGKMFGAMCIKTPNGKAVVMLWKDDLVVKLEGKMLSEALNLTGAKPFDPMGGRPMKEWVQVPFKHHERWKELAMISTELVRRIIK